MLSTTDWAKKAYQISTTTKAEDLVRQKRNKICNIEGFGVCMLWIAHENMYIMYLKTLEITIIIVGVIQMDSLKFADSNEAKIALVIIYLGLQLGMHYQFVDKGTL